MFETLKSITIKNINLLTIIGLLIIGILFSYTVQTTNRSAKSLTNNQEISPQTITSKKAENEIPASLKEAVTKAQYKAEKVDNKLIASNSANNMKAEFDETGLSLSSTSKTANWQSNWRLKTMGFGDKQTEIKSGELISKDQRVEIKREESNLIEWFENRPNGLEHGYTLAKRPANSNSTESLRLVMEVTGNLKAVANQNGQSLTLKNNKGKEVLQYKKLKVWDADNKEQLAKMHVSNNKVFLEVEETNAKYPLTIDPTFTEQQKLLASDGAAGGLFGSSVSISGNTAIVGLPFDDIDGAVPAGSAYIFEWDGANWIEQQKLTSSDGASGDEFGYSVSISGDTAIVGAYLDDDNGSGSGSAYIFVRSGGVWTEQQKLISSDNFASDTFGKSVSISGDTAIIGAYGNDDNGGASGSAYIFVRSGGIWSEQQKLLASDGASVDYFGWSVAISGDTAIVGAYLDDDNGTNSGSAYIFEWNGTSWIEQKLLASNGAAGFVFGRAVSISGDTAIVGSYGNDDNGVQSGSAYIFVKSGGVWIEQQKLLASDGGTSDSFGWSVSISGDTAIIGAYRDGDNGTNSGSAYVFKRNGASWNEQQKLTSSDGVTGDNFGSSVSISGNTAIVGAWLDDDNGSDSGSAYIFPMATDPDFTQTDKLLAPDGTGGDAFGYSVAIDGNTAVIGAVFDVTGSFGRGSVYIFEKIGGVWTFQQKLNAFDGAGNNNFGHSVDISGDTVIVGASHDSTPGTLAGSAYVYVRSSGTTWTLEQKLLPTVSTTYAQFGISVAIDGDTAVAGANGNGSGAAFVFVRSGTTWIQEQKLTGSATSSGENFGVAVAISGDSIIAGAYYDDITGATHCGGAQPCPGQRGTAYVFTRSGINWTEEQILFASDGGTSDFFGISLAISDDTAIVGSALDDVGGNANQGSAYVFVRSGTNWTEVKKIIASDGAAGDQFGSSIAIEEDKVVIGAFRDNVGGNSNQGSAYVFERNKGGSNNWGEFNKLIALDGAGSDEFGYREIGFSGGTIIVGSYMDDDNGSNSGSAYIFSNGVETIQASSLTVTAGSGDFDGATTLSATLTNTSDSSPLNGKTVNFTLNGSLVGSAVTNASGEAILTGISLTGISVGNYPTGVEADFAGDMDFEASNGDNSLTVNKANQTITFGALADKTFGDASFNVSATSTSSLAVGFAASGDCTILGSTITITEAGSCTITASQSGDSNYNAATNVDQVFNIGKATLSVTPDSQTITFGDVDPTFTFSYSGFVNSENSGVIDTAPICEVTGVHSGVGSYTITCSGGVDNNYNFNYGTATLNVIYNFNGFFDPIDNLNINNVKAGRGIPVKFSLNGNFGLNILAAGYPASYQTPCNGNGDDGAEIPTVTAGNSSLSYSSGSDQYKYVWKIEKSWKGTCRTLVIGLNDGTFHTANFKFK